MRAPLFGGAANAGAPQDEWSVMSGAMRRIGEYLGLLEDTGHYDEYDGQYDPRYDAPQGHDHQTQETAPVQSPRAQRCWREVATS